MDMKFCPLFARNCSALKIAHEIPSSWKGGRMNNAKLYAVLVNIFVIALVVVVIFLALVIVFPVVLLLRIFPLVVVLPSFPSSSSSFLSLIVIRPCHFFGLPLSYYLLYCL